MIPVVSVTSLWSFAEHWQVYDNAGSSTKPVCDPKFAILNFALIEFILFEISQFENFTNLALNVYLDPQKSCFGEF